MFCDTYLLVWFCLVSENRPFTVAEGLDMDLLRLAWDVEDKISQENSGSLHLLKTQKKKKVTKVD